tara:strand:- start:301 stop:645 length:345 start_codon:yes stop_codon:yes gene_type:complete
LVRKELVMKKILILFIIVFLSGLVKAESDIDQWIDSQKTYKDLINEGFEVKSYDTTTINAQGGIIIILFVTVLQKNTDVFECQEYQTLDGNMQTLDLSIVCRELTQPYQRGVGT